MPAGRQAADMTDLEQAEKSNGAGVTVAELKPVPHLTPGERAARGKAARAELGRSVHGEFESTSARRDPVALLEGQAATRVPELVPLRYGRMLVSPFTFFRGGAYLMAADLASHPRSSLHTQLCGDAHLSNFGGYAAPDRTLVLDINDFDETLPGPFEWDVKRLAASFSVAGRDRGFDEKTRRSAVRTTVRAYRKAMAGFATMRNLDLWYSRLEIADIFDRFTSRLTPEQLARAEKNVAKARTKDSMRAFTKMTHLVDGEPRIASDPPVLIPIEDLLSPDLADQFQVTTRDILRRYRRTLPRDRRKLLERFRYVHAARKVVGVGSVGTRAWICLLLGRDGEDPLFLQMKEAQNSVLEPFLGRSEFTQHGQRVVEGQRMMQAASDIMLGWDRAEGLDGVTRDFYVRQLWDGKGSALIDVMEPNVFEIYGKVCGAILARAHARSGDPIAISSYLGKSDSFDRALADFAELYADQNERDYAALQEAVASGRVVAETGV
jgi:Uncharacterized protein conserved in bacteria (DUF2252)